MKIIKAKCGAEIIVDDQDYELFKFMPWNISPLGYARTYLSGKTKLGKHTTISWQMHKFFYKSDNKFVIDHINHNKLDNRRSNLRLVDRAINALNTKLNLRDGVGIRQRWKNIGSWMAILSINDYTTYLGSFAKREDAILFRKQAINYFHKERLFDVPDVDERSEILQKLKLRIEKRAK